MERNLIAVTGHCCFRMSPGDCRNYHGSYSKSTYVCMCVWMRVCVIIVVWACWRISMSSEQLLELSLRKFYLQYNSVTGSEWNGATSVEKVLLGVTGGETI